MIGAKREGGRFFLGDIAFEWRILMVENVEKVMLVGRWCVGVEDFGGGECRCGYVLWGMLIWSC